MEIQPANKCIDKSMLADLEAAVANAEQEAAEFDTSCYNGDACRSSSG